MCGIAGLLVDPARGSVDVRACLSAVSTAMAHRGPDDQGLFVSTDGRVGLVNQRLAVVDLSAAGHMPMRNAEGTLWITHNGEIYNAAELRAELESRGPRFRSTSDTEVILRGYEAWGPAIVPRLRGMFAFAIYEERGAAEGRLLLARDRLGIKPLYYAVTAEAFVFASELKALQASGLVSRELSAGGVVGYLTLGSVPGPRTIYRDVQGLPPGSTLSLEVPSWRDGGTGRRYWSLSGEAAERPMASDPVGEVRALLADAVRSHLVSDAPLGAFLSGGLDSSAVVTLMRTVTSGPIRTCSMAFEETEFSEAPFARAVAEAVGAEHHERVIPAAEVGAELDRILWAMDQPTIDGVNTYFVSKTAREAGLTVALSGLGGDELFGGYPNTFHGVPRVARAARLAGSVPGGAALAGAGLRWLGGTGRWGKVAEALERPPSRASAYLACRGVFAPGQVRALVEPDLWQAACQEFDPIREIGAEAGGDPDWFAWVSRAELGTYTRHQLLRDTDVMSMAHSLEVRVPLLDHRLVEGVLRLPSAVKRNGGRPKPLLLQAVGDLLPPAVRDRRDKQGFVFPFDQWLRGPLRATCLEWSREPRGLLRADGAARIWRAFEAGRVHWSRPLGARRASGLAAGCGGGRGITLGTTLAVIETHPIQYHAPVYRMLATRFNVPVTVIYGSDFSVTGYRDPEFDATFAWDTDLLGGYTSVFLSRVAQGGARSPGEVSSLGIRRALREAGPAVVLLVGYSPRFHQVAFHRAWSAGLPILFRGETTDDGARSRVKTWVRDRGLRWFYRRCARLLYVGRRSYEHFRRLGCRDAALVFSPYCVDACTFEWDESARARLREHGRRALGLSGDHILILFSGKLSPRKGPELILRAARALPEDIRPRLAVAYLGDGELRAALEREGQSATLASVRFLGFQNQRQLSPYYHAADLLVLPSLYSEPWGLVVNEGLQHGLPCVVSDAVGCGPDLIEEGVTGAVFERGSSRSLASAMLRSFALIGRADARARCREQVEAYGVEKAAEGIAVAYEAVVGGGPRPDPAALTRHWHSRLPPSKTRGCVDAGRALS